MYAAVTKSLHNNRLTHRKINRKKALPSNNLSSVLFLLCLIVNMSTVSGKAAESRNLVVATRLHLGNASKPREQDELDQTMLSFLQFASRCRATCAFIAVDSTPKIQNYDLVEAVKQACHQAAVENNNLVECRVIPVTPWGKFVPALNALVSSAARHGADLCLFCSAETEASAESIQSLCGEMDSNTLVAGALLPGHCYHASEKVQLDGRTTPWNTLALWNVPKLALNGFALVSEGLHPYSDGSEGASGVEEAVAIAILQAILGEQCAMAKLVKLPDVQWEQEWPDEERRKWHERKMKSKSERAERQMGLTGLKGWVHHC